MTTHHISPMHRRRSIRLKGYDYSQAGAYFVTMCTHNRDMLFGEIAEDTMVLNNTGHIVADEWLKSAQIRAEIELDAWVVMPNHIHGIVVIIDLERGWPSASSGPSPRSLGALVAGFKSAVTKRINADRNTSGKPVWQRNYYEHIIRNETSLNQIRQYIADNPSRWSDDRENYVEATGRSPHPT